MMINARTASFNTNRKQKKIKKIERKEIEGESFDRNQIGDFCPSRDDRQEIQRSLCGNERDEQRNQLSSVESKRERGKPDDEGTAGGWR